ncbi:MAG: ImmA/IrrE family metallo-endopeptidase [Oscillospiraceae bacterium]|nr:ImmA/IrrE family metallo-endopeptidase [Oscillospiraceae bacterium]
MEYIHREAAKLVCKCRTRNPFKIAKIIGVHVIWRDDFVKLKGLYKVIERNRFIFINSRLDEYEQKLICAHELGHDALHRTLATYGILQDMMHCDMKSRPEYEANVFAADILLDDKEIFDLARDGYTEQQIASELCVDVNLLIIKMNEMNKRSGYGFKLSSAPRGGFLGD